MYKHAKIRVILSLIVSALVIILGVLYLALGSRFGIYDWRLGILSLLVILLSVSVFLTNYRDFKVLFLAQKCPACNGILKVFEIELKGKTTFGSLVMPPILDRVSKCTLCLKEHHDVYAKRDEAGTKAPIGLGDSFSLSIHTRASLQQLLRPNMTDAEIKQLHAQWDSYPKQPETTVEEWEAILADLKQEARAKNIEAGMVFDSDKK